VVKLGRIVNFVSHPVILGFMNAAAIIIGLSQLDMLLGLPKGRSDFFLKDIWEMLRFLPQTHLPTLAMSMFSLMLMLAIKKISILAKPGILVVMAVTTLLSAWIGFEHNETCKISEIATLEARALVSTFGGVSQRIGDLNANVANLSGHLRQAEKGHDARTAADLRYQLDLLKLDIKTLELENEKRLHEINLLSFVRATGGKDQPLLLYQSGKIPVNAKTDGRRWHIKKIEKMEIKIVGGGEVVGVIPLGLPSFRLPTFSLDGLLQLLTSALVIALVAFMESISMAKALAGKAKQRIDPNQELIGQGLANIGGSFFQSYPACGSFTASAVNLQAGAKTGFAMVFNGIFIAITLLFLTSLIYHLPQSVLAANNLLAVAGLLTFQALKHTWKVSRADGVVALTTFAVTLLAAPHLDRGIMVGTALSVGLYLYRTMAPRVAILGRYGDGTLRDLKVNPGLATSPHVTAIRFDGSLFFANVAHFEDAVLTAVAGKREARYLLVVGDGINSLDSSGEEMLHNLLSRLHESGMETVFSGLKKQVLDILRASGLSQAIGEDNIFATQEQALAAIAYRLGETAGNDALLTHP
jgi:SulP family sulfate permease